MVDDNQERESVFEKSSPSEDNKTTLTPIIRTVRKIESQFEPVKKACGLQAPRNLRNLFPQKNITYKKNFMYKKCIIILIM